MGADFDSQDLPSVTSDVTNLSPVMSQPVWKSGSISLPADRVNRSKWMFTANSGSTPGLRALATGFTVCTAHDGTTDSPGEVWCEYSVEFSGPVKSRVISGDLTASFFSTGPIPGDGTSSDDPESLAVSNFSGTNKYTPLLSERATSWYWSSTGKQMQLALRTGSLVPGDPVLPLDPMFVYKVTITVLLSNQLGYTPAEHKSFRVVGEKGTVTTGIATCFTDGQDISVSTLAYPGRAGSDALSLNVCFYVEFDAPITMDATLTYALSSVLSTRGAIPGDPAPN